MSLNEEKAPSLVGPELAGTLGLPGPLLRGTREGRVGVPRPRSRRLGRQETGGGPQWAGDFKSEPQQEAGEVRTSTSPGQLGSRSPAPRPLGHLPGPSRPLASPRAPVPPPPGPWAPPLGPPPPPLAPRVPSVPDPPPSAWPQRLPVAAVGWGRGAGGGGRGGRGLDGGPAHGPARPPTGPPSRAVRTRSLCAWDESGGGARRAGS